MPSWTVIQEAVGHDVVDGSILVAVRRPEVAGDEPACPDQVLLVERLVESVFRVQARFDGVRKRLLTSPRPPGHRVHEDEGDD